MPAKKTTEKEVRVSREQETWDNIDIHASIKQIAENPGILPNIPAREGFVQRWIRTKIGGEDDPKNIAKASNQHWRRRDPSTIPNDLSVPTIYQDGIGESIGISGMILMERPIAINDQYKDRVTSRTKAQMDAVDRSLYESSVNNVGGAPKRVEDKTTVSVGGGMPDND